MSTTVEAFITRSDRLKSLARHTLSREAISVRCLQAGKTLPLPRVFAGAASCARLLRCRPSGGFFLEIAPHRPEFPHFSVKNSPDSDFY
jgi:hypothetical protein